MALVEIQEEGQPTEEEGGATDGSVDDLFSMADANDQFRLAQLDEHRATTAQQG